MTVLPAQPLNDFNDSSILLGDFLVRFAEDGTKVAGMCLLGNNLGTETPEISWTTTKAYRTGDHALIDNLNELNDVWYVVLTLNHTFRIPSKDSQTRYSMVQYGTVFFSPFPHVPLSWKPRFALKDSPSRPALLWSRGRKSKLPDLRVVKPKCSKLSWHETEKRYEKCHEIYENPTESCESQGELWECRRAAVPPGSDFIHVQTLFETRRARSENKWKVMRWVKALNLK